jgi:hypothetical protein
MPQGVGTDIFGVSASLLLYYARRSPPDIEVDLSDRASIIANSYSAQNMDFDSIKEAKGF